GAGTNDKYFHRVLDARGLTVGARWTGASVGYGVELDVGAGFVGAGELDAGADEKKEIDKKNCDEDEAADEDVGFEAHHGLVAGKVRRRNVFVLVVAFVMMFGHAHKLTLQTYVALGGAK